MRVLLVGASGLLGKEIAGLLAEHEVISASRKGADIAVDLSDKSSIEAMYSAAGKVDAVICVAGTVKFAPLESLADGDFAFSLANKLMGQVNLVRCAVGKVTEGGSVTLTSGILAQTPMVGSAAVSIVNAGVEAFVRSAGLELKDRLRVNVVSPGWVAETLQSMGKNPADGVPAAQVARAYKRALDGGMTGEVISAAK
jgi:NAD(P)-dependent dehydrogenase (short-subunit alcohol dehydrogenase family)